MAGLVVAHRRFLPPLAFPVTQALTAFWLWPGPPLTSLSTPKLVETSAAAAAEHDVLREAAGGRVCGGRRGLKWQLLQIEVEAEARVVALGPPPAAELDPRVTAWLQSDDVRLPEIATGLLRLGVKVSEQRHKRVQCAVCSVQWL